MKYLELNEQVQSRAYLGTTWQFSLRIQRSLQTVDAPQNAQFIQLIEVIAFTAQMWDIWSEMIIQHFGVRRLIWVILTPTQSWATLALRQHVSMTNIEMAKEWARFSYRTAGSHMIHYTRVISLFVDCKSTTFSVTTRWGGFRAAFLPERTVDS